MNLIGRVQYSAGVKLAACAPVKLGSLLIRPDALEVESLEKTISLEPRCMKVLVVFCQHIGSTVSREHLIDQCWEGRIITDGALNRCVAQVRKVLALDPALTLDTVPSVGYRLRAPNVTLPSDNEPPLQTPANGRWGVKGWHFTAVAVAVAGVAILSLFYVYRSGWRAEQVQPLTSEPGVESYPALDASGQRLAYAKMSDDGSWDLFLRTLDGSRGRALTRTSATEIWPAWRPDGQALAFVRTDRSQCAIMMVDLTTLNESKVADCDARRVGRPTFAGADTLLFSDGIQGSDQRRIYRANLNRRTLVPLTTPPGQTEGDMDPVVSPDGQRLLFRRTLAWGVDDIMVGELSPDGALANVRPLTRDGCKAHGISWSSDSREVLFTSNRGGDWGLWAVSATGGKPERMGLGTTPMTKIGSGPKGQLAVEMYNARSDLRWRDGENATVSSVMADVWTVAVAPNGDVAFVSNESGSPELWRQSGDTLTRLTRTGASYVHGPAWSGSGDRLAFVAIADRAAQIFEIRADGGEPVSLTTGAGDKRDPAYVPGSDDLIWLAREKDGWQLMQMARARKEPPQPLTYLGSDWDGLAAGNGLLIAYKTGDPALYRLSHEGDRLRAVKTAARRPDGPFAVTSEGIIWSQSGRLILTRWDGNTEDKGAALPHQHPPNDIDADAAGRVLLLDRSGNQSDIALMTLSRH